MSARERLQVAADKRRRKPEIPQWVEGLDPEKRSAFDDAVTAFIQIRLDGSKLGLPALIDIIEHDCGKRWSERTLREYLKATYGDAWAA